MGIKDEATVGETPDAADNEDGNGLDGTKTSSETAPEQGLDSKMDGGGTTAEGGVEVANGGFENDNMYRRIRESALEVINAVRCCMVLVQEQYYDVLTELTLFPAGGWLLPEDDVCVCVVTMCMR